MKLLKIPKRSLGQNFLTDKNIINKIVEIGNIDSKKIILEIGPGYGNLTEAIMLKKPKKIIAVEKDKNLSLFLKDKFNPDNFKSKSAKSSTVSAKAETKTSNKKEKTFGFPKAAISFNIKDIAGECNLTTDGYHIKHPEKTLFLLECKHSKNEIPTQDDIEDALFKYHFFVYN